MTGINGRIIILNLNFSIIGYYGKKLKIRIKELEKKHRFIADNLIDAIWIVDADSLRYEYITPSIEKISGYTAEEFLNFSVHDMLTPESLEKAQVILAEERKQFDLGKKVIRNLELESINKNGQVYWVEIRAKFLKEKGQGLKIIGVTREINDQKKAELRENDLLKQLGKALAEKEELLKTIKILKGLLPICSGCKRIRDENGKWWPLDAYVKKKTGADITHSICPDCAEIYGEL